jgi:hypothetical protein
MLKSFVIVFPIVCVLASTAPGAHAQSGYYGSPPPYGSSPPPTENVPHEFTGSYWLPICENPSTNYRCVDIVDGINSGHAQMQRLYGTASPYCAGNTTLGTMTDVATSYVRRNYNISQQRFTDLVLMSWVEAWPCRR